MPKTSHTITTEIDLDIQVAAKWFAGLSDDEMCRFLVAVAAEFKTWEAGKADAQWYFLGGHLKTCECSTDDAREMIRAWAYHAEHGTHEN